MIFISLDTASRLTGYRQGPYEASEKFAHELIAPEGFSSSSFRENQFCIFDPDTGVFTKDQTAIDLQAERDAPPPPPQQPAVPSEVLMYQARRALLEAGLLSQVDAAIAAITDPAEKAAAEIDWEFRPTVHRASSLTTSLGSALGLTSTQIDQLFIQAATL